MTSWMQTPCRSACDGWAPSGSRVTRTSSRDVVCGLGQRQLDTRARGALDGESVAEVAVEASQRLDHQVVHRKPDRAAPVRVAAEEIARRLGRLVDDFEARSAELDRERPLAVTP